MGIAKAETKIKTFLGVLLALGGIAYGTEWQAISHNLPEVITAVLTVLGVGVAATGPSLIKKP